jgi:preprotein translocase subunit SecE
VSNVEKTSAQKNAVKKPGFGDFIRETRSEIAKITWPTRKETITTTILVMLMAVVAGVFFLGVDSLLGYIVTHFLGMNS